MYFKQMLTQPEQTDFFKGPAHQPPAPFECPSLPLPLPVGCIKRPSSPVIQPFARGA